MIFPKLIAELSTWTRVGTLIGIGLGGSLRADSTVVFNEIMYHPSVAEPTMEWLELYNQMSVNMDLSNWALAGGVEFKFPEGTVLVGGGYLVVANNPSAFMAATGATNVVGPLAGRLSNSGEKLELRNNNRRVMDEVSYGTDGEWPVAADGAGVSLAKRQPNLASAFAVNWRASAQLGGTPGGANFPNATTQPNANLIASTQSWSVDNLGKELDTSWSSPAFDDHNWSRASAPFYGGSAVPPGGEIRAIPSLYPTGVGVDGKVLAPGSRDPHYTVLISAEKITPPPPDSALVIEGHPAWLANDDSSSWLGPINPGSVNVAAGDYRVRTTFDLTGFEPGSAILTLAVAADNRLKNVFLNGVAQGFSFAGFNAFSSNFKINAGFVAGTNSLEFLWANDTTSANPAGFRAKVTGTARSIAVPESALIPVRPTTYFRTQFSFNGSPANFRLTLQSLVDDGAVFYLNGHEVYRQNMPAGPISFSTTATTVATTPLVASSTLLTSTFLKAGTNVFAAEIHQAATGDNQAWFSAELFAQPIPLVVEPEVVFNEMSAGGTPGFFVELVNRTPQAIALAGYVLHRTGTTNSEFAFPMGLSLAPRGQLAVDATDFGFFPQVKDTLTLIAPGRTSIADAVIVRPALQARSPDSTGRWLLPAQSTPGSPNVFALVNDVVINEIMYHPREAPTSPGPWLELFNRSTNALDLTGWRFTQGIDFRLPTGTIIPGRGYLVVAKDPERMHQQFPGVTLVGPYMNNLSHHSDRLVLSDAVGNPEDEVQYLDGGRWPALADGEGSSLELRNPWSDHSAAESWAASRESIASGWSNYTYRAVAIGSPGPTLWKEFVVGLLDAGECLIDDFRVTESPTNSPVSLLQNGTFENGATSWRFLGTHRLSTVIPDPDQPGNHVLHLVATGPTEHMHNHLETTLANNRAVVNGREYEISFRAKWLAGNPQLNSRLYFNRVARTTVLNTPSPNGTPGAQNSTYEANLGPTFAHLQHTPAVPSANQPVTVSVEIADPDAVDAARLYWSINGAAWTDVPLVATSPGLWSANVPGATAGSIVQFYVQATDRLGASSRFPAAGPASRAMYQVNDQRARPGPLHNLRIIMTKTDSDFLHALTNVMSNETLGATVIDNEDEVFYNVGVHLQGSERGRSDASRVGFTLQFQPDHLYRGVHDGISIDRSGGYTGVGADQDEILLKHALQHAGGLPGMYDDLVRLLPPRSDLTGPGLLILAKYGKVFLDSQYANGSSGSEFKLELIYSPTTTLNGNPQSPKLPQPDDVQGVDLGTLGNDPEVYRWFFLQDNNRSQNDYSPLITLAKALSKAGTTQDTEAHRLMDVSAWARAVAFQSLWGLVDTYPFDNPHNFIVYFRPEDGRALPFLWDMDFNFGAAVNAPLNRATGNLGRLLSLPGNQRLYLGHMLDLITTTYNTNYLTPWINHFGGLVGQNFGGIRTYVDQRVKSVRSQLPALVPFTLTSNGGQDFLVNTPRAVIAGRAGINIKEITVEHLPDPLDFTWTAVSTWQTSVPLILGTNRLHFIAFDFQGQLIASNSITVTSTATGGGLDQDGDGLPDVWELAFGLDPTVANAQLDSDHDGQTNAEEYLAGTDPMDALDVLRLEAQRIAETVHLKFRARAGRTYSILGHGVLDETNWERVQDLEAQIGDHTVDAVLTTTGESATQFYRVVTPQLR